MPLAVEHIRRMRGGAQAHLMRCDDGAYYVVKFQNNPQHTRVLANELLGTRLAARLGLATPALAVVEVRQELIDYSTELVMQVGMGRVPCTAGFQFGSRFPGDPAETAVHDFLPDERLGHVANLDEFAGALVFDKWTCNTNGRQAIFFTEHSFHHSPISGPRWPRPVGARNRGEHREETVGKNQESSVTPASSVVESSGMQGTPHYTAQFVDMGFCFNAAEWSFPDAPLRGLYARHRVYHGVRGMESFAPWLARLERMDAAELDRIAAEIPPEWLAAPDGAGHDELYGLLEQLLRRRARVPDLLLEAKNSSRQPFVNWR